jgi:hypothetical protein
LRFDLGLSIYETPFYYDFILYHPQKWPQCLVIESKWQQVSGSVDEKYPHTILNINLNIKMRSAYRSILLLDGGGYKPGAENWLRAQAAPGWHKRQRQRPCGFRLGLFRPL